MIHLPTWLQKHSVEITPKTLFNYDGFIVLEAEIVIISRACPKRIKLLEGENIYNKSENHKVLMCGMLLDVQALVHFCVSAREWLNLPIKVLGNTRFTEEYELGLLQQNRFALKFQEFSQTPSKTDWMSLEITYVNGEDYGQKVMHIDYTCLNEFVTGWELWSDQHDNALRNGDRLIKDEA